MLWTPETTMETIMRTAPGADATAIATSIKYPANGEQMSADEVQGKEQLYMAEFIIDGNEYLKGHVQDPIKVKQELARCKDCKFYPDGKGTTKWLPCREIIVPPMWFCADGKKSDS